MEVLYPNHFAGHLHKMTAKNIVFGCSVQYGLLFVDDRETQFRKWCKQHCLVHCKTLFPDQLLSLLVLRDPNLNRHFRIVDAVLSAIASTSTHFVKYSTRTSRYLFPDLKEIKDN